MSKKWVARQMGKTTAPEADAVIDQDGKYVVLLVQGKNSFGDPIYCYAKVSTNRLAELKGAIETGNFNIRDYGDVVAAGRDNPDEETQAEMEKLYGMRPLSMHEDFADPSTWVNAEEEEAQEG